MTGSCAPYRRLSRTAGADVGYLVGPRFDAKQAYMDGNLVDMGEPYGERALVKRLATDLAMFIS